MEHTTDVFKALGDETRLRILALLTNGELCVCDLMAALDMPQSTVSRHLARLKAIRLVTGRRNGIWMYYSLAEPQNELQRAVNCILYGPLLNTGLARRDSERLAKHLLEKKKNPEIACS